MLHALRYFFAEPGQPWYHAAVWGNVVAVLPCGALAFLWSRTKYWPLKTIHRKLDEHARMHAEHAAKLDALAAKTDATTAPADAGAAAPRVRGSAP